MTIIHDWQSHDNGGASLKSSGYMSRRCVIQPHPVQVLLLMYICGETQTSWLAHAHAQQSAHGIDLGSTLLTASRGLERRIGHAARPFPLLILCHHAC